MFSPLREKRQTKNKTNKRIKRSDLPLVFTIYFCFCFEGLNVSNDFIAFTHLPILICRQKSTDAINKSMILPILENSREFFSILEISLFSRIKKSREIQHHYLYPFLSNKYYWYVFCWIYWKNLNFPLSSTLFSQRLLRLHEVYFF